MCQIRSDQLLCMFSTSMTNLLTDAQNTTNGNLISFPSSQQPALSPPQLNISAPHRDAMGCVSPPLSVQSCSWTAQAAVGQEPDGPLLRSLLLLPRAEPGAVFTLLITGEGPADRRAITDSPQAQGWERYKHPSLSPECDGNVQLSLGSLRWRNPRAQREILKT